MPIRLAVDTVKCQSYRRCMAVAPTAFSLDKDGKAEAQPAADLPRELLVKAARSCPYRAITAIDTDSGEQVFPPIRKSTPP